MIANTIIKAALRRLLVIQGGKEPSAQQYADGLEVLNDLVNSWSANSSLIYEDVREELNIPQGSQTLTIGPTGDLVTARPTELRVASLKLNNIEYPTDLIDEKEYQRFANKTSTGLPRRIYYRETFPNGTIYFERTTDQAYTLILTSMKELSTFPDGTTSISLPAYYERALKANLAIEWADELGAGNRVTPTMAKSASESKAEVIGKALDIVESQVIITQRHRYSIEADSY
ncbi:MAG: hypothetical protein KJO69_07350 [Gammaproteobacteria bacterium]|nr:hypothetical protein [Gammaproteobacteria bacterium]